MNKELPKEVVEKSLYSQMHEAIDSSRSIVTRKVDVDEAAFNCTEVAANHYGKELSEKDAIISKLMGLLKERVWEDEYDRHYSIFNDEEDAQKSADKEWAAFCESHGIDLGGEK